MKFEVEQDALLLDILKRKLGFDSITKVRKLIKNGNVLIDSSQEKIPATLVKKGQNITVSLAKNKEMGRSKKKFPFHLIYEDKYFIAFSKPAGMPMRTDNRKLRSIHSEFRFWLDANESDDELFAINKIDKRESGIILVARDMNTKKFFEPIEDKLKLKYYALCEGSMPSEDQNIKLKLRRNKIGILFQGTGADAYKSEIKTRVMKKTSKNTLLKVETVVILKNQIRASLGIIGNPVVGDKKYKAVTNPIKRLGVHLFAMDFYHPEKEEWISIKTPVPRSFLDLLKTHKPQKKR